MTDPRSPYAAAFPPGTPVRIVSRDVLERFRETWALHHPLTAEQLAFADHQAVVREVGFYHGGDALYALIDVPGTWHEACLVPAP